MSHFKIVLEKYLTDLASKDELFAVSYSKEHKNIEDCATFVCNQAFALAKERNELLEDSKETAFGMTDEEVFSLAIHYYDEDEINVGEKVSCGVVTNQRIELTEEEITQAKQKALDKVFEEERRRISTKSTPTSKVIPINTASPQGSLF